VSTEQRENLEAILRQSAFPAGSDVSEQRRLLRELSSARPLLTDAIVTAAAALGAVPTAEMTIDGIEPRHVVLHFHGGVYVLADAFQAAGPAAQVRRRTRATVISVDRARLPGSTGAGHPHEPIPWTPFESASGQTLSAIGRVRRGRRCRPVAGQQPSLFGA
jgi:acetyl esterase/lipase